MCKSINDEIDKYAVGELKIFIDNNENLYRHKLAVFENLTKKKRKGCYDKSKAPQAFMSLIQRAIGDYKDEFSLGRVSRGTKLKLANLLEESFEDAYSCKEYDFMTRKQFLNKQQAMKLFTQNIMPSVKEIEKQGNGKPDKIMRNTEWGYFIDSLCKEGRISQNQYDTWSNPY